MKTIKALYPRLFYIYIQMQLDLSKGHIKALRDGDLRTDSGIEACTSAAEALQQAMEVELPKGNEDHIQYTAHVIKVSVY